MNRDTFFEGKDFKSEEFKALLPKYYPLQYQKYIQEETKLLKRRLKRAHKILEAGVGIGRLIPKLAPVVTDFIGVDNADLMLEKSREAAQKFPNVKIIRGDLEKISMLFPLHYFDFSLCVWNTLGNVKDEVKVLQELRKVTSKKIFITVYKKGTLAQRKKWYQRVGVNIFKIDEKKEIFYSKSGLKSKSYSLKDIKKIADKANLYVTDSKILAGVMLWVELSRKN